MSFTNPIVGGNGELVREQIKSRNYVPGVSGWIIRRDGTVEFQGGVYRGEILITDPSGSYIFLYSNGSEATIELQPPDQPGYDFSPGSIYAGSTSSGQTSITMQSSVQSSPGSSDYGYVTLRSSVASGATVEFDVTTMYGGPLLQTLPFGLITAVWLTTDSAAIGAGETAIATTPVQNYVANRAYRIVHNNRYTLSGATASIPNIVFRKTNVAGAALTDLGRFSLPASTSTFNQGGTTVFTTDSNPPNAAICMTLSNPSGVNITQRGAAGLARGFYIEDIGLASDFPGLPVFV